MQFPVNTMQKRGHSGQKRVVNIQLGSQHKEIVGLIEHNFCGQATHIKFAGLEIII